MKIINDIHVEQSPDDAFALLTDLEAVGPCLPGATLSSEQPDGSRLAAIEVKFGPMRFRYDGTIRFVEADPATRRAHMVAEGSESSGEGTARANVSMQVVETQGGSGVHFETDLHVSGGIAQIGRGMIEEVGQELMDEFAACVRDGGVRPSGHAASSGDAQPVRPVKASRLLARVLLRRVRHFVRRGPWR